MVQALEQEQENYRSRLFHFKEMNDNAASTAAQRHTKSLSIESAGALEYQDEDEGVDSRVSSRSYGGKPLNDIERQRIGLVFIQNDKGPRSRFSKDEPAGSRDIVVKEG